MQRVSNESSFRIRREKKVLRDRIDRVTSHVAIEEERVDINNEGERNHTPERGRDLNFSNRKLNLRESQELAQ